MTEYEKDGAIGYFEVEYIEDYFEGGSPVTLTIGDDQLLDLSKEGSRELSMNPGGNTLSVSLSGRTV